MPRAYLWRTKVDLKLATKRDRNFTTEEKEDNTDQR